MSPAVSDHDPDGYPDISEPLRKIAKMLGVDYTSSTLFELGPAQARVTVMKKNRNGRPFIGNDGEVATEVHKFRVTT